MSGCVSFAKRVLAGGGTSLLRSEEMTLVQLFIQADAAFETVAELGELGQAEFCDLNPDVNAFQRNFVNEVRRCDEMERKLRFFSNQLDKAQIPVRAYDMLDSGPVRAQEMDELENSFTDLEGQVKEMNANEDSLKHNYLELAELHQVLAKTQGFFHEAEVHGFGESSVNESSSDRTSLLADTDSRPGVGAGAGGRDGRAVNLGFVTGVIARDRMVSFERVLWRSCHGMVFLRSEEIEEDLSDPTTDEAVKKNVFIIFCQGEQLQARVKRICEGFYATLYPCPNTAEDRGLLAQQVKTRIVDLQAVLGKTGDHRRRVLSNIALDLVSWTAKVSKIKAVYFSLNMFNFDVTRKCLIAEAWCPVASLHDIQLALRRATELSESSVPSILNRMTTRQTPPTYFRTNKFTRVFQDLIDAYGVPTYREVNPALFALITFPFIFAIMFGDFGHGILMTFAAAYLIIREEKLKKVDGGEIFGMMFAGRYVTLMMGCFSMYTGLIYNDCFSKGLNIFGSRFELEANPAYVNVSEPNCTYVGPSPYPFGIDPMWTIATNKLTFLNSYKMKLSILIGVIHMSFGICLSLVNARHFKRPIEIIGNFIPGIIFLEAIFGYLCVCILYKWTQPKDWSDYDVTPVMHKDPPSLLLMLINMFLQFTKFSIPWSDQLYSGQAFVQSTLVILAVVCAPWMLLVKPLYLRHQAKKKGGLSGSPLDDDATTGLLAGHDDDSLESGTLSGSISGGSGGGGGGGGHGHGDDEKFDFGAEFVHQAIHTIEFCLGCISNTASYLRLWALSLAHAQLSEVLWTMVLQKGFSMNNAAVIFAAFAAWAVLTIGVLLIMEGLSAFLHALRLQWVEFQGKFYQGEGRAFTPFSFEKVLLEADA